MRNIHYSPSLVDGCIKGNSDQQCIYEYKQQRYILKLYGRNILRYCQNLFQSSFLLRSRQINKAFKNNFYDLLHPYCR